MRPESPISLEYLFHNFLLTKIFDDADFYYNAEDDYGNPITLVVFDLIDNANGDHDPRSGWISDPSGPGNEGTGVGAGGGGGGGGCFLASTSPK